RHVGESLQSPVAKNDCLDHDATPEGRSVRPTSPAVPRSATADDGGTQVAKRLVPGDLLRDVELRDVTIHDAFAGTADLAVPGDHYPALVQHGQRAILGVASHCSVHARAAYQQYSPTPGPNSLGAALVRGRGKTRHILHPFRAVLYRAAP